MQPSRPNQPHARNAATSLRLPTISDFGSIGGIEQAGKWQEITPDAHGDWLGQRDKSFGAYLPLGDKNRTCQVKLFENYSRGLETGRDAWCFNSSSTSLLTNAQNMINVYEKERNNFNELYENFNQKLRTSKVENFIIKEPKEISWTRDLKSSLVRDRSIEFDQQGATPSIYRPFTRVWAYYNRHLNTYVNQLPRIFPMDGAGEGNRTICVAAPGNISDFTVLMTSFLPELCVAAMKGGTQCFPRWIYDVADDARSNVLALSAPARKAGVPQRRDAITDTGLLHFQAAYPGVTITKDDLFYYVYGLLHSPDYRERFADNLSKELPRIPAVRRAEDFWAFVGAGQELADLHCGFEDVEPYSVAVAQGDLRLAHIPDPVQFYRVEKMKFGSKHDRTTVIYNRNITVTNIPAHAYDYVVNGKPALVWVMERQGIRTDKDSGIVSDANAFANETMEDPAYPFKLFCRVITVSLRTMEIVRSLPPLDIAPAPGASAPGLESTDAVADEKLEVADAAE